MTFHAEIKITLKPQLLDTAGRTLRAGLQAQGRAEVKELRMGKLALVTFEAKDEEAARELIKTYCEELLVNPIIEEYSYSLSEVTA